MKFNDGDIAVYDNDNTKCIFRIGESKILDGEEVVSVHGLYIYISKSSVSISEIMNQSLFAVALRKATEAELECFYTIANSYQNIKTIDIWS